MEKQSVTGFFVEKKGNRESAVNIKAHLHVCARVQFAFLLALVLLHTCSPSRWPDSELCPEVLLFLNRREVHTSLQVCEPKSYRSATKGENNALTHLVCEFELFLCGVIIVD
jgi:hypothetical protein